MKIGSPESEDGRGEKGEMEKGDEIWEKWRRWIGVARSSLNPY